MLGRDGGQLAQLCERSLIVPMQTSDRIQEIHVKALHLLVEGIERQLFPHLY
jgi:D-sedoheptulose 7-phosphate isomerase